MNEQIAAEYESVVADVVGSCQLGEPEALLEAESDQPETPE